MTASFPETADIETSSADYASRFAGAAGRFFLETQTGMVLSCLDPIPDKRVLDVGGGHCQLAAPLTAQGYRVTMTGSADICGERAAARLPVDSFTYRTCDSLALPFADRSFPVALSFRLLPHVESPEHQNRLVGELCRVAERMVILDYPDIRSFNMLYSLLFRLKKRVEGNTRSYILFNRRQIATAFAAHGFGQIRFLPQFFWPMVLHRKLQSAALSRLIEKPCRLSGLTGLFGSPVIVCATRNSDI